MSVSKRGASWRGRVRDNDGREVQRTFRTRAEAERWERERLVAMDVEPDKSRIVLVRPRRPRRSAPPSPPRPFELYRFFDARGELLYVGISMHAAIRMMKHRTEKPWWTEVARMDVERLDAYTRRNAERIERDVIAAELPRHNGMHNPTTRIGQN